LLLEVSSHLGESRAERGDLEGPGRDAAAPAGGQGGRWTGFV